LLILREHMLGRHNDRNDLVRLAVHVQEYSSDSSPSLQSALVGYY